MFMKFKHKLTLPN